MEQRRGALLHLAALALFAVIVRLLFLAPYPAGWDDVDFALALEQFDLFRMQPHFPGYPVYILVAQLFHTWLHEPYVALTVLSAVAGGLTVVPLWLLFHKMGSAVAARLTVWLYAVAPLPLVTSIQAMSDALGVFLSGWLAYFAWSAADKAGLVAANTGNVLAEEGASKAVSRAGRVASFLAAAGVTLGLLLGVRVSYIALSSVWLWAVLLVVCSPGTDWKLRLRSAVLSCGAATITCIVWLGALIRSTGGLDSFLTLAVSFTGGHFSDWGGAYQTGSSLLDRAGLFFFRQIGGAGLGTFWPGVEDAASGIAWLQAIGPRLISSFMTGLAIVGLAFGFPRNLSPKQRVFFFVWMVPYLLWAFFAQNVEKPRHILPLLPPLLFLLVTGLEGLARTAAGNLKRRSNEVFGSDGSGHAVRSLHNRILLGLGIIWALGLGGVSYPLLKEAHEKESPMVQLARYVKTNVPVEDSLIFTWEEQRVLAYMSPQHTVVRLRKWEDFKAEILHYPAPPKRIFATGAMVEGLNRNVEGLFIPVAVFQGNPWLYPTYHNIVLYEGTSLLLEELRRDRGE